MKLARWFAVRGPKFVSARAVALIRRYDLSPAKAEDRIDACIATLAMHDCRPTFPTPASIVKRYSPFIRRLQDSGAEIAVHSYDHIDLRDLPPSEAAQQLMKAAKTFDLYGIEARGFRCPYLSYTDELLDMLPKSLFGYSSNVAIRWDLNSLKENEKARVVVRTIDKFYQPRDSQEVVSVPWMRDNLVEIPVCVPDDLQLYDGLGLDHEGIGEAWRQFLEETHKRGELFTLIFHPELAGDCEQPFIEVLKAARSLQPRVWVARLRDISDWWREKSEFRAEIRPVSTGMRVYFTCSTRATVLVRGFNVDGNAEPWDGTYCRLKTNTVDIPVGPRPFVGVDPSTPRNIVSFLEDQGYILDASEAAPRCAIYLDGSSLARINTQVELVNSIERSRGPLVRYWRWPDTAKSALSITGDLDALSLWDYISRLFSRE